MLLSRGYVIGDPRSLTCPSKRKQACSTTKKPTKETSPTYFSGGVKECVNPFLHSQDPPSITSLLEKAKKIKKQNSEKKKKNLQKNCKRTVVHWWLTRRVVYSAADENFQASPDRFYQTTTKASPRMCPPS